MTTLEQLNLFDIEEEYSEKKMDAKETISPNAEMEEVVVVHEAETIIDVQVALLEDERNESFQSNQKLSQLQVMDKVKIVLISEELDSETHNYRKFYEPHLIGKVGEITNLLVSSKGKMTYEVNVYGEKSIFEETELLWIG